MVTFPVDPMTGQVVTGPDGKPLLTPIGPPLPSKELVALQGQLKGYGIDPKAPAAAAVMAQLQRAATIGDTKAKDAFLEDLETWVTSMPEALKQAQVARAGRYIGSTPYVVMRNVNPAWMMSGDDAPQQEGNFILHSGTLFTATLGLEDLVDILPGIYAKTGCRLVLAGDGPYRPVLQRYVEEKKAGHMVDFLGHIGREQLYQLTREARLCVMPFRKTRQLSVAVPNKLFEYMALQKAFVYPDLPGFREILGDDNAGKYVPGDSSDMEKKILSLLTDDALRQGLGLHHKALLQHFTFEKESARLLNLYQSLLSR